MRATSAVVLTVLFAAATAAAQERAPSPAKPSRRSLADGLVRQRIEVDGLKPPRLDEGLELGRGEGPLALLVRGLGGGLDLVEVARGLGDHGASPTPAVTEVPVEEEVVAGGKPKAKAAEAYPTLRLYRVGDGEAARVEVRHERGGGDPVDAADAEALRALMKRLAAARAKGEGEEEPSGAMLLNVHGDAPMQDVVAVLCAARAAGFDAPMLGGLGRMSLLTDETRALLDALPKRLGWKVEKRGPFGSQPVCDGELLVLLDGPTEWGAFFPIYAHCAQVGIWRISLVGQKGRDQRFKLPINLPFDRGL